MQSTLLGIAIVLIVALLAALVGPFFIDWNQYRGVFEREATRLAGIDVRVRGAVDVRLLPSPSLTLQGVEIGRPGEDRLRARTVAVELSLGSLVKGQLRAADMRVAGAEFNVGLGPSGQIDWPSASFGFDPDALSVERLTVEDGRAVLTDAASGTRMALENLWFHGDLRSLAGPMKGEGAFTVVGDLYGYRLVAGRVGEDGGIRLKVGLDPSDRPLSIEADGTLWTDRAQPRFEGTLVLARPAGIALASGQTQMNQPWRLTSRVKVNPAAALLEQIDFQHGPDERAIKLTGAAELKFGARPRLEGVLSARTLDLDRTLAWPDPGKRLPAQALQQLADAFSVALRPTIPVQVGLSVDTVTLGGSAVQAVRGDLKIEGGIWDLERLELRAPGATQVSLSGRFDPQTLAFTGPARIDARDPKALLAWIEGRTDAIPTQARSLRVQGDVTLGSDTIAVERLRAEFDRESVEGRLLYGRARGDRAARLEAEIKAAELDLDAVLAFGNAALTGTSLERPREIALALEIGRASIGGYTARTTSAKLRYDGGGLQLDRLSVADLGGAAFSASGRVDMSLPAPRGNLSVDLDARELGGVTALVAAFAPQTAERLRREATRLAPAKLQAKLTIDAAGAGQLASTARLTIDGRLGAMRVSLAGDATGDLLAPGAATLRLDSRVDSDNGAALIELLGLDRVVAVERRPARLTLAASGPLGGELRLDGKLGGGGIDASLGGTVLLAGDKALRAALQVVVVSADARPLQAGSARAGTALPVALTVKLALEGGKLTLDDLSGTVNGATARGRLAIDLTGPVRADGAIELDNLDATAVLGTAIGMPASTKTAAWPTEPFGSGLFAHVAGRLEFKATRMAVGPTIVARQVRGVLRLAPGELAIEDVEASIGGGRLAGQLAVRRGAAGLATQGRFALNGADAAALLSVDGRPPITGRLTLNLEADGAGLSPASLFGSLAGTGTVTLENAQLASLDPRAFDMAMRAADQGLTIDTQRVRGFVNAALESGRLTVPQVDAAISINAGQARLANTIARADGADLTMSGNFDLSEWLLDARVTLSGSRLAGPAGAGRPDVFIALKGAPLAPQRSVDVSALVGWLTLRAIDQQAKRLESLEEARRLEVIEEARKLRAQEEAKRLEAIEQAKRQDAADLAKRLQAEVKRQEDAARAETPAEGAPPHTATTVPAEPRTRPGEATRPPRAPRSTEPKPGDEAATAGAGQAGAQAPTLPPPIDIRPIPTPGQAPPRAARPPAPRAETGNAGQPRPPLRAEERAPARSVFDSLISPNN